MDIDEPTGSFMRWHLRLSPFDFVIVHRPGRKPQFPDAVSLLTRSAEPEYPPDDDEIPTFEGALLAMTTRSNAPQATPDDDEDQNEAYQEPPEDDDGLHPDDVEDNNEMHATDLYNAAKDYLDNVLGDPDDEEEPVSD